MSKVVFLPKTYLAFLAAAYDKFAEGDKRHKETLQDITASKMLAEMVYHCQTPEGETPSHILAQYNINIVFSLIDAFLAMFPETVPPRETTE